jgi:hypothetical protein
MLIGANVIKMLPLAIKTSDELVTCVVFSWTWSPMLKRAGLPVAEPCRVALIETAARIANEKSWDVIDHRIDFVARSLLMTEDRLLETFGRHNGHGGPT